MRAFAATTDDHRQRARRRLPRFLADYLDGGAGSEQTLADNVAAWSRLPLRQRVLLDVSGVNTSTTLAGQACSMPLALAPLGLGGMLARRGEGQAARAAAASGIPFCLSTVGICTLDEVRDAAGVPPWFQLYMLRDRGVVQALLERAWQAGCRTLLFTVDLPMPGMRHRDTRNGIGRTGLQAKLLRMGQLLARPRWVLDVALRGRPLSFGSLGEHVPGARDPDAFRAWVDAQFDPSVTWKDIAWLRGQWKGRLLLKGILDADDARAALDSGADGLVVSNHGGRQLDGVPATATALPTIAAAVAGRTELLVDGGIRSGTDLFRALALGANGVLAGRAWAWALASGGDSALRALLACWQRELHTAMALTGVTRIADITRAQLDAH